MIKSGKNKSIVTGEGEPKMGISGYGKKKEKRYSFPENTICFFREMCVREPLAALCFLLAVISGVMLPFLSAALPKLVLKGLEEGWEFPPFS